MFRRLPVLVLGMVSICAGIITVLMLAGGRLHPDWTPYFDHVDWCGDRLCLAGIIPGITPWNEAEQILRANNVYGLRFDENAKDAAGTLDRTGFFIEGRADPNAPAHEIMQLSFSIDDSVLKPGLTAGAFVARFGPPCFVQRAPTGSEVVFTLYYPFGTANVVAVQQTIPFQGISVYSTLFVSSDFYGAPNYVPLANKCHDFETGNSPNSFAWRGFR